MPCLLRKQSVYMLAGLLVEVQSIGREFVFFKNENEKSIKFSRAEVEELLESNTLATEHV